MSVRIGIYNMHMHGRGGAEKRTLALADHLSQKNEVILIVSRPADLGSLERYFNVDLGRVRVVTMGGPPPVLGRVSRRLPARMRELSQGLRHARRIRALGLDVFINNTMGSNLVCPSPTGIYMCMFPHRLGPGTEPRGIFRRAYGRLMDRVERALSHRDRDAVASYPVITANSAFTGEWVRKLWSRPAEVVYTVCEDMGPPAAKEKLILHAGRFSALDEGLSMKRQEVMLNAFKGLTRVRDRGWRFHLVGSLDTTDRESVAVADRLVKEAGGLPVAFHFNGDFAALRDLYRRSAIYWHATGYGFPAADYPERQEHFGNTTVEAMSAGAVPVVINSGGQQEIVTHDHDGLLWDDPAELARHTERLVDDPHALGRMSRQAIVSCGRFGRQVFVGQIEQIIDRLLSR